MFFSLPCFGEYVPGQMLVKFRPDIVTIKEKSGIGIFSIDKAEIKAGTIKSLNAKYNVHNIKSFVKKERKFKKIRSGKVVELPDLSQLYLLEFPKDIDVMSAVEEYKRDPSVEFADPNYIRYISTPTDEFYITGPSPANSENQWGLYKIWLGSLEAGNSGWNIETGTNEVRVAVIDTGVNYNHDDLINRVNSLEGYNFVNPGNPPLDDNGHGTHVSGIIGAETNNGTGIAGVDWNCRIIPIKAFNSAGGGSDSNIIDSIFWAVSKEADVINMSFGSADPDDLLEIALSCAATSDCVLVAAAGNNYPTPPPYISYPAYYDHVISVAATRPDDHKASYSNYGAWVDVSAPGGDDGTPYSDSPHEILSTWYSPNNTYRYLQGTSMATPFVSGLAALLRAKYTTMTAEAVAQKIIDYSDNIDDLNPARAGSIGKGRINAFAALGGLYGYISHPVNGETDYGNVQIKGSATGEGFAHYSVEYGIGDDPLSWTTLETSSTTPKLNSVLAIFDATGMDSDVTVKLTVNDLATTEAKVTFRVGTLDPPILIGRAQYGPNPFNPNKGTIMIKYDLTANSDTYIYFFDITGNLICRKFYSYGTNGGNSGTNRVYWDGKNDFDETVANGVYLFRIASEDRTIGKGKIIVLK
jgi:subtilisin family serine protease